MGKIDLVKYFTKPSGRQKQYEAIRAIFIDKMSYANAAKKFGYKVGTLYTIVGKAKTSELDLFPEIQIGPVKRTTPEHVQNKIIKFRKKMNLSTTDIHKKLKDEDISISTKTIERILKDEGFEKLKRRTYKERGLTSKLKLIPDNSANLDYDELVPFKTDCPVAGVFLLLPYIIENWNTGYNKKNASCQNPA